MTRWATFLLGAATVAVVAMSSGSGVAAPKASKKNLLLLDLPALEAAALDAEHARGTPGNALSLQGQGGEVGVILWDELKPGRPAGPGPQPTPGGQGSSRISAIANQHRSATSRGAAGGDCRARWLYTVMLLQRCRGETPRRRRRACYRIGQSVKP